MLSPLGKAARASLPGPPPSGVWAGDAADVRGAVVQPEGASRCTPAPRLCRGTPCEQNPNRQVYPAQARGVSNKPSPPSEPGTWRCLRPWKQQPEKRLPEPTEPRSREPSSQCKRPIEILPYPKTRLWSLRARSGGEEDLSARPAQQISGNPGIFNP
jgi:hypothetical protein